MALLCAHLVRESGGAKADVREAAVAGLLHDLGMLHIAPGLLDSEERLSGDELRPVYVHPLTSSMLVDRFPEYSKEIVRAIVEHHERLDGSGYPRGLAGDAISPLGRVLALAEVVTAMFDGTRRLPEQRVSLLLRINPRRYDAAHVATVHRLLAVAAPRRATPRASPPRRWSRGCSGSPTCSRSGARRARRSAARSTARRRRSSRRSTRRTRPCSACSTTPASRASSSTAIAGEVGTDAALRIELWALAEELLWQLHAAANQLSGAGAAPTPARRIRASSTAWFAAVAALDAPPAAAA